MALEAYRKKAQFRGDRRAQGRARRSQSSDIFVVQKHDATRLHYDFRLALDGVLKSWAVTRGPSLNPGEKRLAVAVEDHPLEYADFEGTIAKGEYGGGSVIVWDNGTWAPLGDAHKGLKKGHLEFELHGQKLNGPLASRQDARQAAREARELAPDQGRRRIRPLRRRRRHPRGAAGIDQHRQDDRSARRRAAGLVVEDGTDREA